jgi:integrase
LSVKRVEARDGPRWVLDFYRDGKRVRKWFTRKGDADAMAAEVKRSDWVLPKKIPTFESLGVEWLRSKDRHRAGHSRNMEIIWRRHLEERWGRLRLDQIHVADVESWARALCASLATTTVSGIVSAGSEIFKLAMRHGLWTKSNPFSLAERPRPPARELMGNEDESQGRSALPPEAIYNANEVARLLAQAARGLERVLMTAAFASGLRRGELGALTWKNVQWEPGSVTVAASLSWVRGHEDQRPRPRRYPPKTSAGIRQVPIPASLVRMLKEWRLQCPKGERDLVFPDPTGDWLKGGWILRAFQRAARKADLRELPFHSARHYFISSLVARGEPLTKIARWVGHANMSITAQVYSHWVPNLHGEDAAIDVLAGADGHFIDTSNTIPTQELG